MWTIAFFQGKIATGSRLTTFKISSFWSNSVLAGLAATIYQLASKAGQIRIPGPRHPEGQISKTDFDGKIL